MIKQHLVRNGGHPWDGRPGWDLLEIECDDGIETSRFVRAAKSKFWEPWLIGVNEETGKHGGLLYKPTGATSHWEDLPPQ